MDNIREMLEQVFYHQNKDTISISFDGNPEATQDITKVMDQFKSLLNNIGVDTIAFHPDFANLTIVTTEDKVDEILKLANDFKATVIHNGFENKTEK